ncbi:hypothetical protein SAMN02745165_01410 [Malonomonas rubra DSM 5091]|uniref:TraB family protein n=1 Tax=Malonomonas rubra DSM 5091 TaxID=1122189 RepID=A0A1M6G4T9_MALRU|nr:hypothetical protein [Malonomonas rubra]SHJ04979.1 hypothetical protein SAMN02745165_01410 [Malonomonas rubra DSM 5091]
MRIIGNIFLILFLNAAALGIADTLIGKTPHFLWLSPLYGFIGSFLTFFAFVLYLGMAFNKYLPKRVLLPPLLFICWQMVHFYPLEKCAGSYYMAIVLLGQLLIGLLALQLNFKLNKKSRLFVSSQFPEPCFSLKNMLRFMLINIPIFPLVIFLLFFSSVSDLVDQQGAGFMCLKPNGLYMVEKTYRKGEKQILLNGMIHLGQQSYYDDLSASLRGKQAILLAEGVSDNLGLLKSDFSYQKIADLLGLASQERMLVEGRLVDSASLDRLEDKSPEKIDVLQADIDLSEFDSRTIKVLNALGHYLLDADSLAEGFRRFNDWSRQHTNSETNQIVMHDLIERRNKAVLSYLPKALNKYDTVVIPWGALHMPGLERAILGKGFRLHEQDKRLSIDFLQLPFRKLWQNNSTEEKESV